MKRDHRTAHPPHPGGRPTCYICFRPESHCLCGLIEPFEAHCNVLVLQHPHERRKYHSTARLLNLGLKNSRLLRGLVFDPRLVSAALAGRTPYLLYPGADAVDCENVPLDQSSTIIVVDGTWSEAGKIVFRNPFLQKLPRLSFSRPILSNYRIRKQPRSHCLSTIESVAHLLRLNALAAGKDAALYERLFAGFNGMIERQLREMPRGQAAGSEPKSDKAELAA